MINLKKKKEPTFYGRLTLSGISTPVGGRETEVPMIIYRLIDKKLKYIYYIYSKTFSLYNFDEL